MKRRTFLAGVACSTTPPSLALGSMADAINPFDDMARIGHAVLRAGVAERDAPALRAALGLAVGNHAPERPAPVWAETIAADFSAGRVVLVEGWVLSRTEARLCALATFFCSAHAGRPQ